MGRIARVVMPGYRRHPPSRQLRRTGVTQRGVRSVDVFGDEADRKETVTGHVLRPRRPGPRPERDPQES